MKSFKILLGLLFIAGVGSTANAQVGYMGRDMGVSISANLWPNDYGIARSSNNRYPEESPFLQFETAISFSKMLSKRWVFMPRISYQTARLKPVRYFSRMNGNDIERYFMESNDPLDNNTPFSTLGVGASFRIYKKYMAPVGPYFGMSLDAKFSSMDFDFTDYTSENGGTFMPLSEERINATSIQLGFEYGVSRVINNKYVIEYGVQSAFSFSAIGLSSMFDYGYNIELYTDYDYKSPDVHIEQAQDALKYGQQANTFLLFHLSFGYLFN